MKVLGFSGSLRQSSHNSRLLESASRVLPGDAELEVFDGVRDLPHYDEDIDGAGSPDPAVARLREAIAGADALLFVTPEYNGSIPGALKNAIDWASRPAGNGAIRNKPAVAISASPGQYGGVWAQADLRRVLAIAGARVIDAEFAVPKAHEVRAQHDDVLAPDQEAALAEILETMVEEARVNAATASRQLAA
ncbi:MAG: NAD(P)H-dependent oxidoreductase [Solirubrobacterales bacterium]